jgi:hypothetical protein
MAQLLEFHVIPEKPGPFHLDFIKDLIRYVASEKPRQRKFAKWWKKQRIYSRDLIKFLLKISGIRAGKITKLDNFGEELLEELQASEKAKAEAMEKMLEEAEKTPQRRFVTAQELMDEKKESEDPFLEILFDRFTELNGYMAKFVFAEIGDAFVALPELMRRVQSNMYHGERPNLTSLENWLCWMDWIGYVKLVGFRYKLTETGMRGLEYLKEIPEEELLAPSEEEEPEEEEEEVEEEEEAEAEESKGPAYVPAPRQADTFDEEDEGMPEEELDLPPEAQPAPVEDIEYLQKLGIEEVVMKKAEEDKESLLRTPPPKAKKAEKVKKEAKKEKKKPEARTPEKPPKKGSFAERMQALTRESQALLEEVSTPKSEPPTEATVPETPAQKAVTKKRPAPVKEKEKAAKAPAKKELTKKEPAVKGPAEVMEIAPAEERKIPAPQYDFPYYNAFRETIPENKDLIENTGRILSWWATYPHKRSFHAQDFGINPKKYSGKGKPFFLFQICCLGRILEAPGSPSEKTHFIRELMNRKVFENIFFLDWTVEKALSEMDCLKPGKGLPPLASQLVYFIHFKNVLHADPDLVDRLEQAPDGEALLRTIREEGFGDSLELGAFWLAREMALMDLWAVKHIDAVCNIPSRETRENAFRLGYLATHYATGFAELLQASRDLSIYFRKKEGYDLAIAQFAEDHGCSFRCRRVSICPYACREKQNLE